MSDSLRDQLLKAGLATSEQVRKAGSDKRGKGKGQKSQRQKKLAGESTAVAPSTAERRRAAQSARDRELNREREVARQRRALDAQLWQVLEKAAKNHADADVRHHFQRGDKLKHLYVTAAQRDALSAGTLAIVGFHGRHYVVDTATGDRLRAMDPKLFVFRHDPAAADPDGDHPVPDDLVW